MRLFFAIQLVALLFASAGSMAAKVEYQHPDVTVVAVDETLDSVLKALGKEMQITVTLPAGINPVINCDIQNKPLERAFKTLLGDLSYSLVWEDDGKRLAGLVILSGEGESAVAATSKTSSPAVEVIQPVSLPAVSGSDQSAGMAANQHVDDPQQAERESQMDAERQDREARMAEEREAQEAEMKQKRQEEEIAHDARMKEEEVQHKAWAAEYLQTYGPKPPQ